VKPHLLRQIPHGRTSVWLLCLVWLLAGLAPVSDTLLALSSASPQSPDFWEVCSATQASAGDVAHAPLGEPVPGQGAGHGKHCQLCLLPIALGLPAKASAWLGHWPAGATAGTRALAGAPLRGRPAWAPGSPRAPPARA
jgi:hypothetical protein